MSYPWENDYRSILSYKRHEPTWEKPEETLEQDTSFGFYGPTWWPFVETPTPQPLPVQHRQQQTSTRGPPQKESLAQGHQWWRQPSSSGNSGTRILGSSSFDFLRRPPPPVTPVPTARMPVAPTPQTEGGSRFISLKRTNGQVTADTDAERKRLRLVRFNDPPKTPNTDRKSESLADYISRHQISAPARRHHQLRVPDISPQQGLAQPISSVIVDASSVAFEHGDNLFFDWSGVYKCVRALRVLGVAKIVAIVSEDWVDDDSLFRGKLALTQLEKEKVIWKARKDWNTPYFILKVAKTRNAAVVSNDIWKNVRNPELKFSGLKNSIFPFRFEGAQKIQFLWSSGGLRLTDLFPLVR